MGETAERQWGEQDLITFPDVAPIFVVGAPRSGTTLLQLMLNAHPRISIQGELHFFDEILQLQELIPSLKGKKERDRFFEEIRRAHCLHLIPGIEGLLSSIKQQVEVTDSCSYAQVYLFLMEEYAKQEGGTRFGEKTPQNVRYLDKIIRIFPKAKIVHIVRDPRATVASMCKAPFTANDVVVNSIKWSLDIGYSQEFKQGHRDSYLEIKYEDLVKSPEATLQRVCAFIEEDYHPEMLQYHRTAKKYVKGEPWKDGTNRKVYDDSTKTWRSDLSGSRIVVIELITRRLMSQFGYERERMSVGHRLMVPLTILCELISYTQYKGKEILRRRRESPGALIGTNRRFIELIGQKVGLKKR